MFESNATTMHDATTQPVEIIAWRAHPAAERLGRAALASLAVLAASAGIATIGESAYWGVVALIVLVLALNRFFFPSRFSIDEEGIVARYPLRTVRMRWDELRRFAHDRYGGYLSRRIRPSRLDAFSGMHLLFDEDRDAVIACIKDRLTKARAAAERGAAT